MGRILWINTLFTLVTNLCIIVALVATHGSAGIALVSFVSVCAGLIAASLLVPGSTATSIAMNTLMVPVLFMMSRSGAAPTTTVLMALVVIFYAWLVAYDAKASGAYESYPELIIAGLPMGAGIVMGTPLWLIRKFIIRRPL